MSGVHATITIDAPIQGVWDTVMDPDQLGKWVTIHRALKRAPASPLTRGSTMEQVLHMRGVSFSVNWTLVEVSPPNLAEWDGRGPAHSRASIRYALAGDPAGPTEFHYTNEFHTPGGRLGILASRMIVGAASEREANLSLQRLRSLLEGH
jgi:uncharacterized protein YndB with AHSA1/START domain